jgi:hypothetical protein
MSEELANFCRESAKRCHEASERATTEELKSYWQEAEARWLSRCAALDRSEAEIPDINLDRSSQDEPAPPSSTRFPPEVRWPRISISLDRVKEWFERIRANINDQMSHSELSPEELAFYREQAQACRRAADSTNEADAKEYWLVAEAHWLSFASKSKER